LPILAPPQGLTGRTPHHQSGGGRLWRGPGSVVSGWRHVFSFSSRPAL
jgi:hypothetical protein